MAKAKQNKKATIIGGVEGAGSYAVVYPIDGIVSDPAFLDWFKTTYSGANLEGMSSCRLEILLKGKLGEWKIFSEGRPLLGRVELASSSIDSVGDVYVNKFPVQVKAFSDPDLEARVLKSYVDTHPTVKIAGSDEGIARAKELGVPDERIYGSFSKSEVENKTKEFLEEIQSGQARYGVGVRDYAYGALVGAVVVTGMEVGIYVIKNAIAGEKIRLEGLLERVATGGLKGSILGLASTAAKHIVLYTGISPFWALPPLIILGYGVTKAISIASGKTPERIVCLQEASSILNTQHNIQNSLQNITDSISEIKKLSETDQISKQLNRGVRSLRNYFDDEPKK